MEGMKGLILRHHLHLAAILSAIAEFTPHAGLKRRHRQHWRIRPLLAGCQHPAGHPQRPLPRLWHPDYGGGIVEQLIIYVSQFINLGVKKQIFQHFVFFMYFCTRNETCSEYIFIHRHADTDAVRGIGGIGGEMFVHRADNAYDTNRRWLLSWRERMYDVEDNTPVGLCALGDGTRRHAATAIPVPAVRILQYRITDSCHPAFGVAKCRCSSGRQSEHSYCTESLIAMH